MLYAGRDVPNEMLHAGGVDNMIYYDGGGIDSLIGYMEERVCTMICYMGGGGV